MVGRVTDEVAPESGPVAPAEVQLAVIVPMVVSAPDAALVVPAGSVVADCVGGPVK